MIAATSEVRSRAATGPRLLLLDHFELWDGECSVRVSERCQRLLVFLALHETPATRTKVAGILWPTVTSDRAFGSLRATMKCEAPWCDLIFKLPWTAQWTVRVRSLLRPSFGLDKNTGMYGVLPS
jgi:hypothetical protein